MNAGNIQRLRQAWEDIRGASRRQAAELARQALSLEGELQSLRQRIGTLTSELAGEQAALSEQNERLLDASKLLSELEVARTKAEEELAAARISQNRAEAELAVARIAQSKIDMDVEGEQATLSTENERLLEADRQLAAARNAAETSREEKEAMRRKINELTAEIESDETIIAAQKVELSELQPERMYLKGEVDRLLAREEELCRQIANLAEELRVLKERHADLSERWTGVRQPPILLTTMPKAATYYLSNLLAEGLSYKTKIVGHQYFPYDTISYAAIKEFGKGNTISQDHFPATEINIHHATNVTDRVVCHVRDPRQAMLSYIYYLEEFKGGDDTFFLIYPRLPRDYFEFPSSEKIDWGIEHWLPLLIEWTEQWIEVADRKNGLQVLITHFEDLVRDERKFVERILDFYQISLQRFIYPALRKTSALHFRKGELDEWRRTLTNDQQQSATKAIPSAMANRLGWSLEL